MHFYVHPEQPLYHADQFDVPYDPLELLHVPVLVNGVHMGHGVHVQKRSQLSTIIILRLSFWLDKTAIKYGLT
jgi:hypothetical protein